MIKQENVNLASKTTFKIGGIAKNFYIPESDEDLVKLVETIKHNDEKFYILSGGSNLLINDEKIFTNVIYMEKVDTTIKIIEDGVFYIGASNRIQNVIREVNKQGYGGFEELFCLPAMFGGIICMNAGIGGRNNVKFNISDFIIRVKVFDVEKEKMIYLRKEDCNFSYRNSIFKSGKYIILGAEIKIDKQDIEISNERIEKRKEFCKKNQEWGKGCFGSCFSNRSGIVLNILAIFYKNKHGIKMSKKNYNWLVNDGTGSYKQAMSIINKVYFLHKLFHKECEREVIIWK